MKVYLEVLKDGKYYRYKSKSMVANFARMLRTFFVTVSFTAGTSASPTIWYTFDPVTYTTVTGLDGSTTPLQIKVTRTGGQTVLRSPLALDAPAGDSSFGLVAGRGTAPVSIDDFRLATQYTEGSSSGQLVHSACSVESLAISGGVASFRVVRTFTNAYTSSQTITEVGLIARFTHYEYNQFTETRFLIARDLLVTPIVLDPSKSVTFRYLFSFKP